MTPTPVPAGTPMKLGERQELFSRLIAKLILKMYDMGYQVRCGDFYARPRIPLEHKKNSLHYEKCAADLNLFKDGVFLERTEDHANFGDYWEGLHPNCRWGGNFKDKNGKPIHDGNHYEVREFPR